MPTRESVQAGSLPVDLIEAKKHEGIFHGEDDATFRSMVASATRQAELLQRRTMVTRTFVQTAEQFPAGAIELSQTPLVSVSSVTYLDTAGTRQTFSSSSWETSSNSGLPASVFPSYGLSWPAVREWPESVQITYVAGYLTPCDISTSADTFTPTGYLPSDTDVVYLRASGGSLPSGVFADTPYFVRDSGSGTFKVALTSGGTAIDLESTGGGTLFFYSRVVGDAPHTVLLGIKELAGYWYKNRDGFVGAADRPVARMPMPILHLLQNGSLQTVTG